MSKLIEINLRPDERPLRQFGFIALAGFALLALLAWQDWLLFRFRLRAARVPRALGLAALAALRDRVRSETVTLLCWEADEANCHRALLRALVEGTPLSA